jgi:hypothetical protein
MRRTGSGGLAGGEKEEADQTDTGQSEEKNSDA